MYREFIILNKNTLENWNNELGWTNNFENAEKFSHQEFITYVLPLEGIWVELVNEKKLSRFTRIKNSILTKLINYLTKLMEETK